MKVYTRQGPVEYTPEDMAGFDAAAKKQLASAKRKKVLRVEDGFAYFSVSAEFHLSHDMQTLIKSLVNLEFHGKTYAAEGPFPPETEADKQYHETHHRIGIGYRRSIPVKFNLKTGELLFDLPVQIQTVRCYHNMCRNGKCVDCGVRV